MTKIMHTLWTRIGMFVLILAIPFAGNSVELNDLDYPAPKLKKSSWQANVFVASALIAAAAGIVVICWDGGTSTEATERLNQQDHRHPHRCNPRGDDSNNLEVNE